MDGKLESDRVTSGHSRGYILAIDQANPGEVPDEVPDGVPGVIIS